MLSANVVVYSLGLVGFTGNVFLGFLILMKTPPILRVYSKLLFLSSLNELICLLCFVWSNMRVFFDREFMVIQFNGACSTFGSLNCFVTASVAEQCCSITSEILCFCFYYRLRMVRLKTVKAKQILLFITFCIVLQSIIGSLKLDITLVSLPVFEKMYGKTLEWFDSNATYAFMYTPSSYTAVVKTISVLFSVLPLISSLLIRSRIISCENVSTLSRNLHEVLIKVRFRRNLRPHLTLFRALNAQLLIISFFAISASTFTLLDWRIIDNVFIQYAIFPIAMLQVTLSPYANIWLLTPYRKACSSLIRSIIRFLCGYSCTTIKIGMANSSVAFTLLNPQTAIRIGYVGKAFPLAYVNIAGELAGIHVEMWKTALRGREIQWEKRTVYGSYDPDENGFFDGMLGEMQNGTLDVALQESYCYCCCSFNSSKQKHALQDFSYRKSRMDELYYSLPIEEWEENFYESREIFFDPAIVVVPFTISFTAILVALTIAMSLTEVAVKAVVARWGGREGSFRISCHSLTLLGALFHRLAIILILIIYNAAFVGLATSPGVEPIRTIGTVVPLLRQGKITLVVNYEDSIKLPVLEELFGDDPRGDAKRYLAIEDMEQKQNVLCHNPSAIFFGRLYSITHNDPDTPYKHQCAFKNIDSADLSILPHSSELTKLGVGKKFLTTFHMSRRVPRRIRERFSFVQLAMFDRDMIDSFWWRRLTNQPRIVEEKTPQASYQPIGLTAFETIFIVFGTLILLIILVFLYEIVHARFFPNPDPKMKKAVRFVRYIL